MPEPAAPSPLGVVCLVPAFTDIMSSDARGASAVYVRTQPRCGGSFSFLILKEQIKGIIIIREEGCFLCVSGVCKFWGFLETHKTAMVRNVLTPEFQQQLKFGFGWGVIASFDRVYTSSSSPQCERNSPQGWEHDTDPRVSL
jgi:hypothetical protein